MVQLRRFELALQQFEERGVAIGGAHDVVGSQDGAVGQFHPFGGTVLHDDLLHLFLEEEFTP